MTGFVYRWQNAEDGMQYIGSHRGTTDDGYIGSGRAFREAYDAAPHLFVREILYTGPEFREVEDEWLIAYDAGRNPRYYNVGSRVGGVVEHTEETRAKMSGALRGVPQSAEHIEKRAEANRNSPKAAASAAAKRGVPRSAETRAKISEGLRNSPKAAEAHATLTEAKRGVPLSAEHRAKLADAKRGVPQSAEHIAKRTEAIRSARAQRGGKQ